MNIPRRSILKSLAALVLAPFEIPQTPKKQAGLVLRYRGYEYDTGIRGSRPKPVCFTRHTNKAGIGQQSDALLIYLLKGPACP